MRLQNDLKNQGDCSTQMVLHLKKISDQTSVCTEDKGPKHQKNSVAGRLVCKLSVDRSGQIEAFVAQRGKFVLHL